MDKLINGISDFFDKSGTMRDVLPDESMEKVLDNIKKAWGTNPNVSFGTFLGLIEDNTNKTILQLTDGEIINVTSNMDISNYVSKDDIKEILNNLEITTVYDSSDTFAGYVILSSDDKSLKDITEFYASGKTDYDDIEEILKQNNGFKCEIVSDDILFNSVDDAEAAKSDISDMLLEELEE